MFYVKNPSSLNKPWILSKKGEDVVSIPLEVTQLLKDYHIIAVEFLYHNYRKGIKGSILNQDSGMNFSLQVSAFLGAVTTQPATILVICSRQTIHFWCYHLENHAKFEVIQITSKNSKDNFESNKQVALIVPNDCLKLCEDLLEIDFFSVIVEDLDQFALKRIIKRLNGRFNVGLTCRSFYTNPDQKLQWNMLNWASPGCVGKLNDFYEVDNKNFERFDDNYRYWWLRLTWEFCESFERPSSYEIDTYETKVSDWADNKGLHFSPESKKKTRKRKNVSETDNSCSSDDTIINEVPLDKYVKLPSMDENPIVTSIIKNFEISPEPILTHISLPYTQTHASYSKYDEESSVLFSFLDKDRPSTSKSESEEFIINLINKSEDETKDIQDILKKADAVLQN